MKSFYPVLTARFCTAGLLCAAGVLASATSFAGARAADYLDLPAVKPVRSCSELGATSLRGVADTTASLTTESVDTPKGRFCKATGVIEPAIRYEITLPEEHWTQRYVEAGCGGLCGQMPSGIGYVTDCAPAQNGEFVLATDDMGHQSPMGSPDQSAFGLDPQKRIDFAYRANHVTTLVAKALIKAFYGQAQRFSYFVGCSDGGREALMEAQRYPDDFDGISAGDPAAFLTQLHSFAGPWGQRANRRADGSAIVLAAKARLVHEAVLAQCDTLSGVKDGILADPRACTLKPQSLRCAANANDTSRCLTGEEVDALDRIYDGATDKQGHLFSFGLQRGAELQMRFPESNAPGGPGGGGGFGAQMVPNLYTAIGSDYKAEDLISFTQANFARMAEFAPLYNATNTNLKPFAEHGGKLLLWHGWADPLIPPGISIAYYQGVQQFIGAAATERFMRLFLMPGVAHCMGGDGNDQVDWLTPLMSWVELKRAPEKIIAGKSAERAAPMMGGGGAPQARLPYSKPAPALASKRPIYPYPMIAKYTGNGDPNDAANYLPAKSPVKLPQSFGADIMRLIAPDNQKNYVVRDGKLLVVFSP